MDKWYTLVFPNVLDSPFSRGVQQPLGIRKNRQGEITNSNMYLTGILLVWLVLEAIVPQLNHFHVVIFYDNTYTVAW